MSKRIISFFRSLLLLLLLLLPGPLFAQVAGLNTLSLLQMSSSARAAALGVDYLPVYDPLDIHAGLDNPSLIGIDYHRRMALDYVGLFSGSHFASAAYGYNFPRLGAFLFGLQANSYGRFEGYDEAENSTGTFTAADYAFTIGWGRHIDSSFSIGATFKPILSQYETYTAFAFSLDIAGSYFSPSRRFAATLMARNIGAQLATFAGTVEELPFDLSVALSYKAANAPFRVFFELNELTRWHLSYDDPLDPTVTVDPYTGKPIVQPWYSGIGRVLDEVARHTVVGVELDINHIFFARVGYRYRQMAEMYAADRTSVNLSGFSYGVGLRTKKFEFSFARRNYHLGQAPTFIALTFKL